MVKTILSLILAVVLFSGCASLSIKHDENSDPLRPTFFVSRLAYPDIWFSVKDNNGWRTIWKVSSQTNSPKISQVTYADLPHGYLEVMKPETLVVGMEYRFDINYGDAGKHMDFKIENKDGKPFLRRVDSN